MKILIVNSYGRDDKGDGALLSALLAQLDRAFDKPQISIASVEDPNQYPDFEGHANVFSPKQYATIKRTTMIHGITTKVLTYALLPLAIRMPMLERFVPQSLKLFTKAFREADMVISVGGGYLNAKELMSTLHLLFVCQYLSLAARLGKVAIAAPVSVGPFAYPIQKFIVARSLHHLDLLMVREDISYDLIKPYIEPSRLIRAVDSGFSYAPAGEVNLRQKLGLSATDKIIAITVRRWFDPNKQKAYETAVASFIAKASAKGYHTVFIPQCTASLHDDDDREVGRAICATLPAGTLAHVIEDDMTYAEVKLAYKDVDFVIGTRFHSVIFALTYLIPCIAIEYEHKTRGIMRELDLEKWTINIADVRGDNLFELFEKLEKDRAGYNAKLKEVIPPYVAKAEEATSLIKQTFEQKTTK